jgi:catechol 2,3-dioxygenase-like lactoylglutathione lyase family enzyme
MKQQMSLITLGVADLARSKRFYAEGFGWTPVFDNGEIVFYQMNGFVLATWLDGLLAADMRRDRTVRPGPYALAHNVPAREEVQPAVDRLLRFGGRLLKAPVKPPHGGFAGYVADPDDHAWEIAWNPAWTIDAEGRVTFGI